MLLVCFVNLAGCNAFGFQLEESNFRILIVHNTERLKEIRLLAAPNNIAGPTKFEPLQEETADQAALDRELMLTLFQILFLN